MIRNLVKCAGRLLLASILACSTILTNGVFLEKDIEAKAMESNGESVLFRTTLNDRTTKADQLTFDVWASDKSTGTKIDKEQIKVTSNDKNVAINWADSEKTSFTLYLTEGENKVTIQITNGSDVLTKRYTIIQEEAKTGEVIGDFVFSIDAFTLGIGYLVEPQRTPIVKGENSAQILDQLLKDNNYKYKFTGKLTSAFYLVAIQSATNNFFENMAIPQSLLTAINDWGGDIDYEGINSDKDIKNGLPYSIGEFDLTFMSGWMYAINDVFPNVGFADSYPQEGDVLRTQFTLYGYGRDIGSGGIWGEDFFQENNKDEATRALAYINSSQQREEILQSSEVKNAYDALLEVIQQIDVDQASLDKSTDVLNHAVVKWVLKNDVEEQYSYDLTEMQKLLLDDVLSYKQRIAALPSVEDVSITDVTTINQLKKDVNSLTQEQIDLIPNISKIEELEQKIEMNIVQSIKQLPAADRVSLDDQQAIEAIRAAYESLSNDQKEEITNYEDFKTIEQAYEQFAISTLTQQINELPEAKLVTLDDGEKINQVLQNYNRLSEKVKEQILNAAKLDKVESKYQSLVAIHQVQLKLNKLPKIDNLTIKHGQQLKEARQAYNDLTEEQQQEVDITLLEQLELKMEQLVISSNKVSNVINLIDNLPSVDELKRTDRMDVELARALFDALSVDDREKVTNEAKLILIESVLNDLENEYDQPIKIVENLINHIPSLSNITLQSNSIIEQASLAYNQLSEEQKQQVSNAYILTTAKAIYDDLKAQDDAKKAQAVADKIATLPSVSLIDLTDETLIKKVKNNYDQLTDSQKQLVLNNGIISELEARLATMKEAALKVKSMIATLPETSKITETDRKKIEEIRTAYTALSTAQKQLVTNGTVLDQAELQLAQLQEASIKKLIKEIDNLPITISLKDEKTIRELRLNYDNLKIQQQALVTNYVTLKAAEKTLESLINKDKEAAEKIVKSINDLPSKITVKDQPTVEAVRKTYNALTETQQIYVSNLAKLEAAEKVLATIKEADQKKAKKVDDSILQLPTTSKVTLNDEAMITSVRKAYNALTTTQKQYVKHYATLKKLEAKLATLQQATRKPEIDIPTIKNTSKTIEGYVTPSSKVVVYKGSKKIKTAKVDKNGFYKVTIPLQKKNTKLKFVVYNQEGKKLIQKTVNVKAATVTAASSVKATTTKIMGKAPKGKTVKVYKGSKLIGKSKSSKKGTFVVKMKKQKKGAKLKIIVLDSVGNKSKTKTVTVK